MGVSVTTRDWVRGRAFCFLGGGGDFDLLRRFFFFLCEPGVAYMRVRVRVGYLLFSRIIIHTAGVGYAFLGVFSLLWPGFLSSAS